MPKDTNNIAPERLVEVAEVLWRLWTERAAAGDRPAKGPRWAFVLRTGGEPALQEMALVEIDEALKFLVRLGMVE